MAINKKDREAASAWGVMHCYPGIPKSVFALVAYHLCQLCADDGQHVWSRFGEEVEALAANGLIDPDQARRVMSALTMGGE